MNKKRKVLLVVIGIFILSLSIISTIAFFTAQILGNPSNNNVSSNMDTLRLTFSDNTGKVEASGINPGWTYNKTVTVQNVGTASVTYDLVWLNVENEITNDEMVYSITCSSNCNGLSETSIPSNGKNLQILTNTINKNETQTYTITFTFIETNAPQDYNQNKNFSGNIGILETGSYEIEIVGELSSTDWTYTLNDTNKTVTLTKYKNTSENVEIYSQYKLNNKVYSTIINSGSSAYDTLFISGETSNNTIKSVKFLGNVEFENNSMAYLFLDCSALTSVDVSKLDTSNISDMNRLFALCSHITTLDLSNFNTQSVTKMCYMFSGCSSLTTLDLSNFNTTNVTNMTDMFSRCSALTSIDVTHFNTSNVKHMGSMFSGCSALTSIDVTHFDTSNAVSFTSVFEGCSSLTSLDLSHFNTSNIKSMNKTFKDCNNLITIYVSNSFDITKLESYNSKDVFINCISLVGGNGTTYNSSKTGKDYARIDAPGNPGYFTAKA